MSTSAAWWRVSLRRLQGHTQVVAAPAAVQAVGVADVNHLVGEAAATVSAAHLPAAAAGPAARLAAVPSSPAVSGR